MTDEQTEKPCPDCGGTMHLSDCPDCCGTGGPPGIFAAAGARGCQFCRGIGTLWGCSCGTFRNIDDPDYPDLT